MEKGYLINEPELATLLRDNIITQLFYDSNLISDELKDKIIGLLMTDIEALYRDTFEKEDLIPVPCNPDALCMAYALKLNNGDETEIFPMTRYVNPEDILNNSRSIRFMYTIAHRNMKKCSIFTPIT